MVVAGKEDFTDPFRFQNAWLKQRVFKYRLAKILHLIRAMAVHKPVIVTVHVGHNIGIGVHNAKQIGGDIAIQVMAEDQIALGVMHPRTVGGDHVCLDLKVIADLGYVDMVAPGCEHKVDVACR